jgi:type VI secretion system FHA domain protein
MAIKLRVISNQYRELGEHRSRVFGVNGGSVGRAPDNDWVLPDSKRIVSGHHFEVEYRGGAYWLKDMSTNGVFVNDSEEPVSVQGDVELRDGDQLRVGDYDIVVSVDNRMDFLPAAAEEHSAAKHIGPDIGHALDLDSLLSPRNPEESGSISMHNAFGLKVPKELRQAATAAATNEEPPLPPVRGQATSPAPAGAPPQDHTSTLSGGSDWNLRTRPISREELADALARRQSRTGQRERSVPFHQQAATWADLRSAVQAFCRGAGIDPTSLTPEAQSMLPLVAGQMLREAVVGLNDLTQARAKAVGEAVVPGPGQPGGSNPLRTSSSVDQAIQRLFESHGRLHGGPVDALRDVMQEIKEHEIAMHAAVKAGMQAVLGQLSPSNVADQFEQGRSRTLAPGQDPRPRYWEHYAEFFRMLTQQNAAEGLPRPFTEEFDREYGRMRAEMRSKKQND